MSGATLLRHVVSAARLNVSKPIRAGLAGEAARGLRLDEEGGTAGGRDGRHRMQACSSAYNPRRAGGWMDGYRRGWHLDGQADGRIGVASRTAAAGEGLPRRRAGVFRPPSW
ncbi:hypothetical protein CDD83_3889 [Cordyceps sp. RAO-2017]|nr:hypothetical protein CDD83_3889 [Cordyceps sp. RAO-2017]